MALFRKKKRDISGDDVPESLREALEGTGEAKKDRKTSPLKKISKKKKKERKAKRAKPIVFATAALAIIVSLFVIAISYMVAPSYVLTANIKTIHKGYELTYDVCQIPVNRFNDIPEIGDRIYVTVSGYPSSSSKNNLRMIVDSINDDMVFLSFVARDIPTFITTEEMIEMAKTASSGKIYRTVNVSGKILGNRFVLDGIEFSNH